MAPLPLTYASCRYDRIEPLRSGEVHAEGIDLNVMVFPSGRQIFDRMVGGGEFDASELSASEFVAHAGRGNSPFVAIPVFPSRVFRHGYIFINKRSGIRTPKDLEDRRVGLPLYTQTASIWLRGHLMHQFGVGISKIRWVQARSRPAVHTATRIRCRCFAPWRSSKTRPDGRSASSWRAARLTLT